MNGLSISHTARIMGVMLSLALLPAAVGQEQATRIPQFIKGYSWGWVGSRGEYAGDAAAESMRKLAETGTEWVCIAFGANMRSAEDPDFTWGDQNPRMVTDAEVRRAIDLARENNLKVILKPVINIDDGTWRAWIKFFRPLSEIEQSRGLTGVTDPWGSEAIELAGQTQDLSKWATWWNNFEGFLTHYAEIAAEKKVELFCVGCEMNSTEQFELEWRRLIGQIREIYAGPLTYDANHGREATLPWWDAVDVISVSAYYPVRPPAGQSAEDAMRHTTPKAQIVAELEHIREELAEVYQAWQKPILFIETGVTNVRGCARAPWSHPDAHMDRPLDEAEQANYYAAMFEVFWDEPWLLGYAWWDWPARLYPESEASNNRGFCVYGKQAESVLREWYANDRDP